MRVALICRIAWPVKGGLTYHALRLGQELKALGTDLEIFTRFTKSDTQGNDYFWRNEESRSFDNEGVQTHVIGLNLAERLFLWNVSRFRTRWYLLHVAKKQVQYIMYRKFRKCLKGYDIIHYDGGGIELMGYGALAASRHLGIPFLVQPSIHINQWGNHPLDHALYRKADGLLVHSSVEKKYLVDVAKVGHEKIKVVGNGVDKIDIGDGKRFREKYNLNGSIILFLGRRSHDKGYYLLHDAFKIVAQKHREAFLVVIGPLQPGAQKYVPDEKHPGKDRVLELDYVNDQERADAYAACDIFCQPSIGESFGLVFVEAALCGKPIVARNLEILEELLGQYGAGLLVGKRKMNGVVDVSAMEIADALILLLKDADLRQKMGQAGRRAAEKHLWPNVAMKFYNAYKYFMKNG